MTLVLAIAPFLYSDDINDNLKESAPKVYIDCEWCDIDFIKTEIPFVNYVRDRTVADIHILIVTQRTGSGGTEYTITFIGQHDFDNMDDTLKFISEKLATEDTVRKGIARALKLGLMRYVARTPVADEISISFVREKEPVAIVDRWNNWVFSIDINSYLNGEQARNFNSIYGSFSANRITEEWKIRSSIYSSYSSSSFKINDTTIIRSTSTNYGSSGFIAKGVNDHWSAGSWASIYSSTYSNMKTAFTPSLAVEYNIFPYSQSTSRELRMLYRAGYRHHRYCEETIYDKVYENLLNESVSITLETTQRWGSISTTLEGSHYLHDFTKNRLTLFSNLSLQLIKGFSFSLFGQVSLIHDQLSLPKRDLTPEEILLQRMQLATQYHYYLSLGFTYSFGSIYSNIVNPRFGD